MQAGIPVLFPPLSNFLIDASRPGRNLPAMFAGRIHIA
jgi:hypothetical protein